jgi:tRNA-dihydrouridine synthase B
MGRKHIGWYSKGLPGSAGFREIFNSINDVKKARIVIDEFYLPLLERQAA